MKKQKQLSFSFIKEDRNLGWLETPLQFCKRVSTLLLLAQIVVSLGRIWILTH